MDLRRADGQARGVAGILQQHRQLRVEDPGVGTETRAPLLEDDATLLVDLGRFERHGVRPVLEEQQGSVDDGRAIGRNPQLVDRLIEAGVGVDVGAKAHSGRLQERDPVLLGKVTRPVEGHVLDKVRQPALVVVFEHRSGVHHEPDLGTVLRLLVGADVVAHPVRERAHRDPWVDGNGGRQGRVVRPGHDGALARGGQAGANGECRKHHDQRSAGAHGHGPMVPQVASAPARSLDSPSQNPDVGTEASENPGQAFTLARAGAIPVKRSAFYGMSRTRGDGARLGSNAGIGTCRQRRL